MRTSSRRVLAALEKNDADEAGELFRDFSKLIDTAARKRIYHPNTAARKKSRLAKKVNALGS